MAELGFEPPVIAERTCSKAPATMGPDLGKCRSTSQVWAGVRQQSGSQETARSLSKPCHTFRDDAHVVANSESSGQRRLKISILSIEPFSLWF